VKQFAKKERICGQTTREFCTMITYRRTIIIREFLTKNKTNTIQQPSNSPDMAPCNFFLFDRVKKPLRGTRFNNGKIEDGSDDYTDNRVP